MKHKIITLFILIAAVPGLLFAQKKYTKQEYIDTYKDVAIELMQKSGIPASIILAQACLESGYGNSGLTQKSRNHFGIKCHKNWTGERVYFDDDEKGECFRKYAEDRESFVDHSDFLRYNKRYAFLFDLDPTDYKAWAKGLKQAGYATNTQYAELLIKTIEDNNLSRFDKGVEVEVPSPLKLEAIDFDNFVIRLNRKIYTRNGVKFIITNEYDTYENLADEFKLRVSQLKNYNEIDKNEKLVAGKELYIKPKKAKSDKNHPVHIAQEGETMKQISQRYAIKLKALYHYNQMKPGEKPEKDQKIFLHNKMRR